MDEAHCEQSGKPGRVKSISNLAAYLPTLVGQVYGKWTVLEYLPESDPKHRAVRCVCACGNVQDIYWRHLPTGWSTQCQSCAGRDKIKHGCARTGRRQTPEYNAWAEMRKRCSPAFSRNPRYRYYGGKGIKVCDRWSDFSAFLADMGPRPTPQHSIDRIDTNGDYSPENCRWATQIQQARNKTSNRIIEYDGRSMCLSAWSEEVGVPSGTISSRLDAGMDIATALRPGRAKRRWGKKGTATCQQRS